MPLRTLFCLTGLCTVLSACDWPGEHERDEPRYEREHDEEHRDDDRREHDDDYKRGDNHDDDDDDKRRSRSDNDRDDD